MEKKQTQNRGLRAEIPVFDDAVNNPEVKEAWNVIMKRLGLRTASEDQNKCGFQEGEDK